MTIRQIAFTSRQHAEALAGSPRMAVISITDPGTPEARLDPRFGHVLRLAFFDAVPADEYLPAPLPGLFSHAMAKTIGDFVEALQQASEEISVIVHCEFGVSRSAAVALFVEAYSGAPLQAREYTHEANLWVIERLTQLRPCLEIEIPSPSAALERRREIRPATA